MPDINDLHRQGVNLMELKQEADLSPPVQVSDTATAAAAGLAALEALRMQIAEAPNIEQVRTIVLNRQLDTEFVHAASYAWAYRQLEAQQQLAFIEGIPKLSKQAKMLVNTIRAAAKGLAGGDRGEEEMPPLTSLKTKTPPVVLNGQVTWLLDQDGTYTPVLPSVLGTEVQRIHGVSCWDVGSDGKRRLLSAAEIYALVGVTAKEIHWSCSSDQAQWNPETREMTIPAGRYRPGPARRNPVVEEWLARLCGKRLDIVMDWIAGLPRLDVPCSALTIVGPASCGKSMFATACATLYGGYVDYNDLMSRFNAGLVKTPFVWLDERASREGDPNTFRRVTADYVHRVEAKFQPIQYLHGHPRLLATANHPDPWRLADDQISPMDDEAIGKRIIFVEASPAAGFYLEGIGGAVATKGWCDPEGALTCHLRWIAENREVKRGNRFWIDGDAGDYMSRIGSQNGIPSVILDAIARYLSMTPQEREAQIGERSPCRFDAAHPDAVLVSANRLVQTWSILVGGTHQPDATKVRAALTRLSRASEKVYDLANGDKVRCYKLYRASFGERVDETLWPVTAR